MEGQRSEDRVLRSKNADVNGVDRIFFINHGLLFEVRVLTESCHPLDKFGLIVMLLSEPETDSDGSRREEEEYR